MMIANRHNSVALALAAFCLGTLTCATGQNWRSPVWSDEFDGKVMGAPPDPTKWTYDVGSKGWGNNELETYCAAGSATPTPCDAKRPNAYQDGQGNLVIQAIRTSASPPPAGTWTSARIKTLGLKNFQYGRLEACMVLPTAAGLWPAFWMLGSEGQWPLGGEMDIMENVPATGGSGGGLGPSVIESTIHGPSSNPSGLFSLAADVTLPTGQRIDDKRCHVYGTVWSPFMVQIYVDDWQKPFFIRTANQVPEGGRWIFNAPFYFILNLAVGGDWPGPPNSTTPSPAQVLVDYVRVYQAEAKSGPKMSAEPIALTTRQAKGGVLNLTGQAESGYVYLACSTDSKDASCAVDTSNPLNPSVIQFGTATTLTATITIKPEASTANGSPVHEVMVTAFGADGSQSSLKIPVVH